MSCFNTLTARNDPPTCSKTPIIITKSSPLFPMGEIKLNFALSKDNLFPTPCATTFDTKLRLLKKKSNELLVCDLFESDYALEAAKVSDPDPDGLDEFLLNVTKGNNNIKINNNYDDSLPEIKNELDVLDFDSFPSSKNFNEPVDIKLDLDLTASYQSNEVAELVSNSDPVDDNNNYFDGKWSNEYPQQQLQQTQTQQSSYSYSYVPEISDNTGISTPISPMGGDSVSAISTPINSNLPEYSYHDSDANNTKSQAQYMTYYDSVPKGPVVIPRSDPYYPTTTNDNYESGRNFQLLSPASLSGTPRTPSNQNSTYYGNNQYQSNSEGYSQYGSGYRHRYDYNHHHYQQQLQQQQSHHYQREPLSPDSYANMVRSKKYQQLLKLQMPALFPFECHICHTSFRIKGYLTRHLRKHIRKKPFVCPFYTKDTSTPDPTTTTTTTTTSTTAATTTASTTHTALCHPTGGFTRRDTYKTHLKALHFQYPPGVRSNCRNKCEGKCKGCGVTFANNEIWIKFHLLAGNCPGLPKVQEDEDGEDGEDGEECIEGGEDGVNSSLSFSPNVTK